MSLDTHMNEALKEAMKSKDQARLRTLRSIKSAFLLAKTAEGAHGQITEADELKILQKLYKQRKDSFDIFSKEGRDDLAVIEEEEMKVIEGFLPSQLNDEELKVAVRAIIGETGASSMKDMGKVMGQAVSRLSGQADSARISTIVREQLSA